MERDFAAYLFTSFCPLFTSGASFSIAHEYSVRNLNAVILCHCRDNLYHGRDYQQSKYKLNIQKVTSSLFDTQQARTLDSILPIFTVIILQCYASYQQLPGSSHTVN